MACLVVAGVMTEGEEEHRVFTQEQWNLRLVSLNETRWRGD